MLTCYFSAVVCTMHILGNFFTIALASFHHGTSFLATFLTFDVVRVAVRTASSSSFFVQVYIVIFACFKMVGNDLCNVWIQLLCSWKDSYLLQCSSAILLDGNATRNLTLSVCLKKDKKSHRQSSNKFF